MNRISLTETSAQEALQRYKSLLEASIDALALLDNEGNILENNSALESLTGVSSTELKGTSFFSYFKETPAVREMFEEIRNKGKIESFPLTLKHQNGRLTDVLFNGSVYKGSTFGPLGITVVARNITEQKRFEKELIEARSYAEKEKQVAEEAMKAKQQFLSNMSHEIRTPLNAIIGFTKVLLKTELTEKQKEYLTAIKISGDALIVLINDILDLAKVESGKMTFEQIPFKLSDSVSSMLHLFETKLFKKKIGLVKEYDHSIPEFLVGDPVRLHQIILNLVGNAVKFTSQGKITVSVKKISETDEKATIEFSVSDTGIGIAENELDKIFENFQQASGQTARLYGGTGLGLAIVKQLVLSQGGTLKVESQLGSGSTFSFTLEFKKTREPLRKENEQQPEIEKKDTNANILVVEDVTLNQLLMKTLLEEFGFSHDTAGNGRIAIEKLEKNKYDLILMDLQMPEMNGYEATEYIRNKMNLDLPIIALTADVTTADVEKCKAVGMNDYIAKPVDDKLLYNKIKKYIRKPIVTETTRDNRAEDVTSEKVINLDYLQQHTKGNPNLVREMIRIYLEETPKLVASMKQSINEMDWETLGEAAHSIIPTFSIMGIHKDYEEMARDIKEHALKKEKSVKINTLVEKIENVCTKAIRELSDQISTL